MFFMLMGGNYFRLDGKCFRYGHSAFPYVAMRERMDTNMPGPGRA